MDGVEGMGLWTSMWEGERGLPGLYYSDGGDQLIPPTMTGRHSKTALCFSCYPVDVRGASQSEGGFRGSSGWENVWRSGNDLGID